MKVMLSRLTTALFCILAVVQAAFSDSSVDRIVYSLLAAGFVLGFLLMEWERRRDRSTKTGRRESIKP